MLHGATWPGRIVRWTLGAGLVLAGLLLIGAAGLAWRLSQGPLDVTWLVRRIGSSFVAPNHQGRVAVGKVSVAWDGFQQGASGGLEVRVQDGRVLDASGDAVARVDQADATLSLGLLLEARVVPRSLSLTGLRLMAVRDADGSFKVDLGGLNGNAKPGGGSDVQGALSQLRQPATSDARQGGPPIGWLAQLQSVRLHDAQISIADRAWPAPLQVDVADLDLQRQGGGGVKGAAEARLRLGGATASVRLNADLLADGGTHVEAKLAPLQASAVAQADPALASVGALDAALQGTATLDLSPDLAPRSGSLHATASSGTLSVKGGSAAFDRLALDASASWSGSGWRPDRVTLSHAEATALSPSGGAPTVIAASGEATRQSGTLVGKGEITVDQVAFADLPALWPAAWGGHVRPWLTENLTAGVARDGRLTFSLSAPENDPASVHVTDAGGSLQGDDVTIHWLRPVLPIEHAQAHLTVLGPDALEVAVPTASQGNVMIRDGLIRFTGLSQKDQFMALTTRLEGSVPDVLQVLRHPRLKLLDKHPLPIADSAGSFAGTLSVTLPLEHDLTFDQVEIAALGRMSDLRLDGVIAGRDLERGDVQFAATQAGLHVSGAASVARIASKIAVEMDFTSGPPSQMTQRAALAGRANARQLKAAGLDTGGAIDAGTVGLDATFVARRDGSAQIAVTADLDKAGLSVAGWTKAVGPAASASATIMLQKEKLVGINNIQASGPGMRVVGRAEMEDGRPSLLRLETIELGPTRASGEVRFPKRPGAPIRARVSGPVLDLSDQLSGSLGPSASGTSRRGTAWVADARFERVVLSRGQALTGVTAHAESDGRRVRVLQAQSTGKEELRVAITPEGTGRRLTVRAADAGALLKTLDVVDSVHGGSLAVDGHFDDRKEPPPLSGTADMSSFGVRDAVILGKLLQAVTIYGIYDAVRGEGVQFSRLILPFTLNQTVLQIGQARSFSSSLGLTAHGWIDFGRKHIDLRGTIVPAYVVNSALGRIPLVGRLFSPETGGGLLAVSYSLTGNSADPSIGVNPLSALTPGFLRGLFSIFK